MLSSVERREDAIIMNDRHISIVALCSFLSSLCVEMIIEQDVVCLIDFHVIFVPLIMYYLLSNNEVMRHLHLFPLLMRMTRLILVVSTNINLLLNTKYLFGPCGLYQSDFPSKCTSNNATGSDLRECYNLINYNNDFRQLTKKCPNFIFGPIASGFYYFQLVIFRYIPCAILPLFIHVKTRFHALDLNVNASCKFQSQLYKVYIFGIALCMASIILEISTGVVLIPVVSRMEMVIPFVISFLLYQGVGSLKSNTMLVIWTSMCISNIAYVLIDIFYNFIINYMGVCLTDGYRYSSNKACQDEITNPADCMKSLIAVNFQTASSLQCPLNSLGRSLGKTVIINQVLRALTILSVYFYAVICKSSLQVETRSL